MVDVRKILSCRTDLLQQSQLTNVFHKRNQQDFLTNFYFSLKFDEIKTEHLVTCWGYSALVWLLFAGAPAGVLSVGYCCTSLAVCFVIVTFFQHLISTTNCFWVPPISFVYILSQKKPKLSRFSFLSESKVTNRSKA